ncbi:formylglycine-generating enzyme family protein [Spirochaetota bacterium]
MILVINLYSADYEVIAKVESRRKGRLITVLFKDRPQFKKYLIMKNNNPIGLMDIISVVHNYIGPNNFRVIARYRLKNALHGKLIRSGSEIALKGKSKKIKLFVKDEVYKESIDYKKSIYSKTDNRHMLLIPSGKFVFGSDSKRKGRLDEYPKQVIYLPAYYIDKYEVSNGDYKKFIDATNTNPPISWKGGEYNEAYAGYPVLVTYYEAASYAKWAGKRLPNEKEWEKAARGPGIIKNKKPLSAKIYPWGRKFNPARANSIEFWQNKKVGMLIKKKYRMGNIRILPVFLFPQSGASPYGVVNMSGNVMEWTSSWYLPYKGNYHKNVRYGRQYKVVRGGAWFSNRNGIRAANRDIGGIPNLYRDNLAGFRCIKDVSYLDKKE